MSTVPDRSTIDEVSFDYVFEQHVSVPLMRESGTIRANVFRPKATGRYPVLVTYGPYGKDVPYANFHPSSFAEVNEAHKSTHSAWETPDPVFWTKQGYAIVRADEIGTGQSPGLMDTVSRSTRYSFADLIEWAAHSDREWSNGKVGILGVSYYAMMQWSVAALHPKGLCCIVPWEGMSDYYRDMSRHGGILSNAFMKYWWDRQVASNQYGLAGRAARGWGLDTLEGDKSDAELVASRHDPRADTELNFFANDEYYSSRAFNIEDVKVPVLSVGNWGGIGPHLRGNVEGYMNAGSTLKYLRLITGRHDLPFYTDEGVALQLSFLNAFLKGVDDQGWTTGKPPAVAYKVRQGNPGFNTMEADSSFEWRMQSAWPIPETKYVKYFLTSSGDLNQEASVQPAAATTLSYKAMGTLDNPQALEFRTPPFKKQTEITGHIVAHLNLSATREDTNDTSPMDIDVHVTLRHIAPSGEEVQYTGTVGDPVPVVKGWLRVSLRETASQSLRHQPWHPHREYLSSKVALLRSGEICSADVDFWPTNVVVDVGGRLVFELSSGDTQGVGLFRHDSTADRPSKRFAGMNHVHFGGGYENWLMLPEVPQ